MRKLLLHTVFAVTGWRAVGGGRVPVFDVEHWCSLAHGETAPGRPRAKRMQRFRKHCGKRCHRRAAYVHTRAANRPDRRLEGEPGHISVKAPACQEAATITPAYLR